MKIGEARLYLEHTSKDDFNLEEWQKENRYQAIQVILQEIERLNNIIKEKNKDFELLRKAQLKKCQEYENLEKLNNANYQSFIEVNNIINKAIDFLKENACIDEDVEYFCDDLRYDDCKKLLNILKGEDK